MHLTSAMSFSHGDHGSLSIFSFSRSAIFCLVVVVILQRVGASQHSINILSFLLPSARGSDHTMVRLGSTSALNVAHEL